MSKERTAEQVRFQQVTMKLSKKEKERLLLEAAIDIAIEIYRPALIELGKLVDTELEETLR